MDFFRTKYVYLFSIYLIILLYLWLNIGLSSAVEPVLNTETRPMSGLKFREQPNRIVYQSTKPLVFLYHWQNETQTMMNAFNQAPKLNEPRLVSAQSNHTRPELVGNRVPQQSPNLHINLNSPGEHTYTNITPVNNTHSRGTHITTGEAVIAANHILWRGIGNILTGENVFSNNPYSKSEDPPTVNFEEHSSFNPYTRPNPFHKLQSGDQTLEYDLRARGPSNEILSGEGALLVDRDNATELTTSNPYNRQIVLPVIPTGQEKEANVTKKHRAYFSFSKNESQDYNLDEGLRFEVEGKASHVPIARWVKYLLKHNKTFPDFFIAADPFHRVKLVRDWPKEFQIALWESVTEHILTEAHPDYHYKKRPLGILRLLHGAAYDEYQSRLVRMSRNQIIVPRGQELPPDYKDIYHNFKHFNEIHDNIHEREGELNSDQAIPFPANVMSQYSSFVEKLNNGTLPPVEIKKAERLTSIIPANLLYHDKDSGLQVYATRTKRAPGFLSYCCDVLYHSDIINLESNTRDIHDYMEKVKMTMTAEQQEIMSMMSTVKEVNFHLDDTVKTLQRQFFTTANKIMGEAQDIQDLFAIQSDLIHTANLLTRHITYNSRNISVAECRNGHIPHLLVTQRELLDYLIKYKQVLKRDGGKYELAISETELSKYYSYDLASCTKNATSLLINLKIPLRRVDVKWTIYSVTPVGFVHEGKICSLASTPQFVAISNKQHVRIIDPVLHSDCAQSKHTLCFLPQFNQQFIPGEKCIKLIYFGATIAQITKACKFTCEEHDEPVIIQLGPTEYAILNPTSNILTLEFRCEQNIALPTKHKIPSVGTHLLSSLPCHCRAEIWDHKNHLAEPMTIYPPYPCQKNNTEELRLIHSIPAYWLKQKDLIVRDTTAGHQVSSQNYNLSALINEDLTHLHGVNVSQQFKQLLNVTNLLSKVRVPGLLNVTFATHSWILTGWQFVITSVLTIVSYVVFKIYIKTKVLSGNEPRQRVTRTSPIDHRFGTVPRPQREPLIVHSHRAGNVMDSRSPPSSRRPAQMGLGSPTSSAGGEFEVDLFTNEGGTFAQFHRRGPRGEENVTMSPNRGGQGSGRNVGMNTVNTGSLPRHFSQNRAGTSRAPEPLPFGPPPMLPTRVRTENVQQATVTLNGTQLQSLTGLPQTHV